MSRVVRAALVQTRWTGDQESMIDLHERCSDYVRHRLAFLHVRGGHFRTSDHRGARGHVPQFRRHAADVPRPTDDES